MLLRSLLLSCVLFAMAACGQIGPLVLPASEQAKKPQAAITTENEAEQEDETETAQDGVPRLEEITEP